MAKTKPTIPSQKKAYAALKGRINQYSLLVQGVFDTLAKEAAAVVAKTGYAGSVPFHFNDYPQTADAVRKMLEEYVSGISGIIHRSTAEEWKNSNLAQDLIADKAWTFYWKQSKTTGKYAKIYHQANPDALKAFQERKDKGMGLDAKLWKQTPWYKEHLETAISTAIQKGDSAQTLYKNIISHLADYSKMSKEYKARYGKDAECPNCIYAAQRLARTEINMAYRMAEQKRWQQFDFVLGYEIKTSESHRINDICNHVVGRYPKTFVFKGWHPACFCYCLPILKTEDEYFDDAPKPVTQPEPVETFPDGFSQWIGDNCSRVLTAEGKGTLPYWLTDNKHVRECAVAMGKAREFGEALQHAAESVAQGGTVVTEINYKSFASMYRKLMSTCQGNIDYVNDAVRTTIIADSQDIQGIIAELKKHPDFSGYHHQSPYKFNGYSGNIVNLRASNGIMGEIQVNTPKMIYAKETEQVARKLLGDAVWEDIAAGTGMPGGVGHNMYEEMRMLDKHKHKAKLADLSKQSQEYYAHFHSFSDKQEVKLFSQAEALLAQEADFAGMGIDFSTLKYSLKYGDFNAVNAAKSQLSVTMNIAKGNIVHDAQKALTAASTVAEVDSAALQAAVKVGKLAEIKKLTAQLDADIKAMLAREQAISDIIPDVGMWHKQFSIADLEGVHKAVKSKIASFQAHTLGFQESHINVLKNYIANLPKDAMYPVTKAAYEKALVPVVDKIDWYKITYDLPDFEAFAKTTHSSKFVSLLSDFKAAIASNDKTLATQLAKDVADMQDNLIAKAAKAKAAKAAKKAGAAATAPTGTTAPGTAVGKLTSSNNTPQTAHQDIAPGMTKEETIMALTGCTKTMAMDLHSAVFGFSYQWDYEIRHIQCGMPFTPHHGHTMAEIQKKANDLETFIDHSPKWAGGTTYRGMKMSDKDLDFLRKKLKAGEGNMLGSASWSTKEDIAKGFSGDGSQSGVSEMFGDTLSHSVVLYTQTQTKATSIRYLSNFYDEHEVLASKDCRYLFKSEKVVKGTFGDIIYIEVEPSN